MARETAAEKRKAQQTGVQYGCYVDLEAGEQPDGCVKDYGSDADCTYAPRHRTREGCRYWRRISKKGPL